MNDIYLSRSSGSGGRVLEYINYLHDGTTTTIVDGSGTGLGGRQTGTAELGERGRERDPRYSGPQ